MKKCSNLNHKMRQGQAIINSWSGNNDFVGASNNVVTMSMNPKLWSLVDVLKCIKCGYSVSK